MNAIKNQICINNTLPSWKKDRSLHMHTHTHTHTTNLPFKWTVMSSSKHEPSRQQGVVTPPRPLVQSARLLPARLGTAEWRMEGRTSCGSVGGGGGWAWISDRLRDVEMEGKIRGQGDGRTDWKKNGKGGRCRREKICGFWMQKRPVSPHRWGRNRPSPYKHVDSIYPLYMSRLRGCRVTP